MDQENDQQRRKEESIRRFYFKYIGTGVSYAFAHSILKGKADLSHETSGVIVAEVKQKVAEFRRKVAIVEGKLFERETILNTLTMAMERDSDLAMKIASLGEASLRGLSKNELMKHLGLKCTDVQNLHEVAFKFYCN